MPSFVDVITGALAKASDVQQIIDALKGTAGKGVPLSLTSVNDAINFALSVKNNDATASKAFIVYKADGTVLFQADKNGVIASADGITSASQIPTLTGTQTLTNKTLTAPTITGLLTLTDTASRIVPGATSFSVRDTANANDNLLIANAGLVTIRGPLSIGTTPALTGGVRLPNVAAFPTNAIAWRNGANTGDDVIGFDSTDALVLAGAFSNTTVGAAGGASAPPATPAAWMRVLLTAGYYKIPLYTNA